MQCRSVFLPIMIFMICTNTSITHAMETEKNKSFLQAVIQLPPEIQKEIAFYLAGEFFLVANILRTYTKPIKSLVIINDELGIERYHNQQDRFITEDLWNIHSGKFVLEWRNPHEVDISFPSVIGYGPLDIPVVRRDAPQKQLLPMLTKKKKIMPLYINLQTPELNSADHPLTMLKNALTIPQARLIVHLYHRTKRGHSTTLYTDTGNHETLLSCGEKICSYLKNCLNMKIKPKPVEEDPCIIQ